MDTLLMAALSLLLPFVWANSQFDQTIKPSYSPPSSSTILQSTNIAEKAGGIVCVEQTSHEPATALLVEQLKELMTTQHKEIKKLIEGNNKALEMNMTNLLQDQSTNKSHSMMSHIFDHKIALLVCVGIGIYGYIGWCILQARAIIQQPKNWSSWQDDATLEILLIKSQEELQTQLLLSIAHYYTDPKNPTDFVHPLLDFTANIQEEIEASQKLLGIYTTILQCKMGKLFNITEQDATVLKADIQKLLYIVHTFTAWHSSAHPMT